MEKGKTRSLNKKDYDGYFEKHHIIPRCMGGSNDKSNLVLLTGREHFMAHMLLWKAYPKNGSFAFAATFMSNRDVCKVNSYLYEYLKADAAKKISEVTSGKRIKDLVGERFSKLLVIEQADFYYSSTGAKQSAWVCECDCGKFTTVVASSLRSKNTQSCGCLVSESGKARSGKNNHMWGKKHTEETKLKFKLRPVLRGEDNPNFGKKWDEERRIAMSEARKGIPWTEERKTNAVFPTGEDHHMFGKSHPPELLKQISESLRARDQRPWENVATQTEESMIKWSMCDYYYDLWVAFGKPGLKVLTKIYNQAHNDDVSLSFFTNPRLKWLTGWIPQEDPKWVEFSKGF